MFSATKKLWNHAFLMRKHVEPAWRRLRVHVRVEMEGFGALNTVSLLKAKLVNSCLFSFLVMKMKLGTTFHQISC